MSTATAAPDEHENDIRKLERIFNEKFKQACGTCGKVNCICDEETMQLMDNEMRDREES